MSIGTGNSYGFYSFEPWGKYVNIMYTEYATQKKTILCSNAECNHDNTSCVGYDDETSNVPRILALDDKILFIYPGNPYASIECDDITLARVDVADIDGSNRRNIHTFDKEIFLNTDVVAYDEDNLYIMVGAYKYSGEVYNRTIQLDQLSLSSGKIIAIKNLMMRIKIHFF